MIRTLLRINTAIIGKSLAILLALFVPWAASAHLPTEYIEGDVIVTFKGTANLDRAKGVLTRHSLEFREHFAGLSERRKKQTGLVRAKGRTTDQLITELKNEAEVETAEPNYLRWVSAQPNDTRFGELWALQNTGQTANGTAGAAGDDIKFLSAWSLAKPNASQVVVGVIDTGVSFSHPDLVTNMWTNPGEINLNSTDDDGNGYVDDYYGYDFVGNTADPSDSGFHGTHVAGTIAAAGYNNLGVTGVAYRAKIMALKVSSDGSSISSSAFISALQYATMMKGRGVNVVALNASFGGGGFSNTEVTAIQAAGNAGIIFCAAAGNSTSNNDTTPTYPANYRLSNMIVVAATDQNDALASFSNYGATTVDIAAPGVNILSTKPASATLLVNGASYAATPLTFSGTSNGITGNVVYCGIGNPGDFPAAVSGNIALIARGTLTFSTKVTNAMAAGARAAVIYNNATGGFLGTLQTPGNWIPTVSIAQSSGSTIKALSNPSGTVSVVADYQYLDGTSMATPHVTGAVAFAAMNFPDETVAQRIQRILTHVDVKPALQGKVVSNGRLNVLRIVDTDGNGLPDWWEKTYFNQLTGIAANGDADGDGLSNLQEFLAGTSPTDASDALRFTSFGTNDLNGSTQITWSSVPGKTYQLWRTDSLNGTWLSDLPNSLITADAGQTSLSYSDTTSNGVPRRFYRVSVLPQ